MFSRVDRRRNIWPVDLGGLLVVSREEGFEVCGSRIFKADNSVLIDEERVRDRVDPEQVQGIRQHLPPHLLPLHKKLGAIGMLFLDDAEHGQFSARHKVFCLGMPPGHVLATACSP